LPAELRRERRRAAWREERAGPGGCRGGKGGAGSEPASIGALHQAKQIRGVGARIHLRRQVRQCHLRQQHIRHTEAHRPLRYLRRQQPDRRHEDRTFHLRASAALQGRVRVRGRAHARWIASVLRALAAGLWWQHQQPKHEAGIRKPQCPGLHGLFARHLELLQRHLLFLSRGVLGQSHRWKVGGRDLHPDRGRRWRRCLDPVGRSNGRVARRLDGDVSPGGVGLIRGARDNLYAAEQIIGLGVGLPHGAPARRERIPRPLGLARGAERAQCIAQRLGQAWLGEHGHGVACERLGG